MARGVRMQALFHELKAYLDFTAKDEAALRALAGPLRDVFSVLADAFYARVLQHPDARTVLERGERQVGQLKLTLTQWMEEAFSGPWDEAYLQRRARIGQVHVRIGLPQQYMITAMNVVRRGLFDALDARGLLTADARSAVERVLDLDLAIMLHTYRDDLLAKHARAERLATYGQLVGSIGHELRNPLGVIETSLYVLRPKLEGDPKVLKHVERIGQQVTLANDIITQLLDLIRERPLSAKPVDLAALTQDVLATLPVPPGLTVTTQGLEAPLQAQGDPTQLRQVLVNLLDNAAAAAGEDGKVAVTAVRGAQVTLHVDDSGPGLAPTVKARLFEPLVTTKHKGIGLGLALVRRIVDRHAGTITTAASPLGGARFTLTLPAVEGGPP